MWVERRKAPAQQGLAFGRSQPSWWGNGFIFMLDQTELGEGEERVDRSLQLLLEAPVGIFETSHDGACRFVNNHMCALSGRTSREMIGGGWLCCIHPEDRVEVSRRWSESCQRRVEQAIECRILCPDGVIKWVKIGVKSIQERGVASGCLGTLVEVSQWNFAAAPPRLTAERLRNAFDSTPFSVIFTDPEGSILDVNRAATLLLGFDTSELIGRPVVDTLHLGAEVVSRGGRRVGPASKGAYGLLLAAAQEGKCREWTYRKRDGTEIPVELTISDLKDEKGNVVGQVSVAADISDRLRRTRELRDAKASADQASAAKAEFLAKMSHEIRTPMNSVLGMTELLFETPLTDQQRAYLDVCHESGKLLLHLVDDILEFSKVEARGLALERIPFDMYECLVMCLRAPTHAAGQKGVRLILRIEEGMPRRVMGDPHRISQVLANLVGNAVKFTVEGEITVDVFSSGDERKPKTMFDLVVSDTGPGIEEEQQERIFEAFAQEDTGIARRFGGTGLGLSICSQLVELMGGTIELESEVGAGSSFHVRVPIESDPLSHEYPVVSSPQTEMGVALVVDPNDAARSVVCASVRSLGYYPLDAASTAEAIDAARVLCSAGGVIAVVVIDVPDWEREAKDFLERLQRLNGPVAVVCVSTSPRVDMTPGLDAVVYQLKPFTPEQLRRSITMADAPVSERLRASLIPLQVDVPGNRALDILVAEDNPTNRLVVTSMLERLGHRVEAVENGKLAVDRVRNSSFDLVVMDLQMPVMGGLEAVRMIRALESGTSRHIPVVALTAQAMSDDPRVYREAGMDEYLCKPLEMSALARVLRKYLPDRFQLIQSASQSSARNGRPGDTCIDFETFRDRIGLNGQALEKLFELFTRDSAEQLRQLNEQVSARRNIGNSPAAHTLKGMLRNICAAGAADLAEHLEQSTGRGDWTRAEQELGDLTSLVDRIGLELRLCAEQSFR